MFCKNCGTEYEGNFCPSCGTSAEAPVVEAPVEKECASASACAAAPACCDKASGTTLSKVMGIVSKSVAFFGAMMAFILLLFLGVSYKVEYAGFVEEEAVAKNIFYFFGDNLKDLSKILDADYIEGAELASYVLQCLLTFFLALAILVLVTVFAIIAIVKFAKSFSEENDTVKASFKVMLLYVLGAAVLSAFYLYSEKGEGVIKYKLNGATVTGLVFCTIAIVGAMVCKLLENPSNFKAKAFLANKITAFVGVAIAFATLIIAANTGVSFKRGGETTSMSALEAAGEFDKAVGIIAQIFMVVAVIFFVFALFRNIKNVTAKEGDSAMAFTIVAMIFAFIGSIILCVFDAKIKKESMGYYSPNMAMPIVLIVFSLLNLGAVIASKVVANKFEE